MRILLAFFMLLVSTSGFSQEAMRRWRKMNQVRNDKLDLRLSKTTRMVPLSLSLQPLLNSSF
ncbi:hypothetical protein [uncultured Imperialibacter sp.]|uniref:hypothetical protein n=1 Tax=uncultured Imperialibacter sp. TaxID=1672639 RepID=UPI0030D8CCB0|tara:strand:- start:1532 stop:1717 length:186 start_codon:yes stop_codon:yes gene_type:complete